MRSRRLCARLSLCAVLGVAALLAPLRARAQEDACRGTGVPQRDELRFTPPDGADAVALDAPVVMTYGPEVDVDALLAALDDSDVCRGQIACLLRAGPAGVAPSVVPATTTRLGEHTFVLRPERVLPAETELLLLHARPGFDRPTRGQTAFRTGDDVDREPPELHVTSEELDLRVEPPPAPCDAPAGSLRVRMTVPTPDDDGDPSSVEVLAYLTRRAGDAPPALRARARPEDADQDSITLTLLLEPEEGHGPLCVALRAVDGVGRGSEASPERCFDPGAAERSVFASSCAVRPRQGARAGYSRRPPRSAVAARGHARPQRSTRMTADRATQPVGVLRYWPLTDVGRVRDGNEDSFLVDDQLGLFVVADGMGGHAAGEVASSLAVHVLRDTLAGERAMLADYERGTGKVERAAVLRLLELGVQRACSSVYSAAQRDPGKRGMGTTLVALLILGNRGFIAHVGDSRIYLIRGGAVHQLTQDHSLINELLKRGRLKPEQVAQLNMKNAVTRAVGVYESVEADTLDFDVLAGDRFLLCTDGLTEYAQDSDLSRLFGETPEDRLAQALIDHANEGGGKDNITALVVKIPDAASGLDRLATEVNLKLDTLHRMPLFRHLTYQELVRVMNLVDVQGFEAGQRVLEEGEEGDAMFIVLTGEASVRSGDTKIAILGPGQHFGEMALVDKVPRSASVYAEAPSKLMVMRRRDFFDVVRKDHDVAVKLLWAFLGVLTERLRRTSRDLGDAREQLALVTASELLQEVDEKPGA
jgi:serine/threonine protein phosphatase PrpC/CRP-like cAMP-binding protein